MSMKLYLNDHIKDFDLEAGLSILPEQSREQALKFKYELGRRTCVAAYLLLCKGLEEEYGIFPEMKEGQAVTINYNPNDHRDIGQPNSMLLPYGVIAAGALALFGGIYNIIRVNRKNRALKKQEEEWKHGD